MRYRRIKPTHYLANTLAHRLTQPSPTCAALNSTLICPLRRPGGLKCRHSASSAHLIARWVRLPVCPSVRLGVQVFMHVHMYAYPSATVPIGNVINECDFIACYSWALERCHNVSYFIQLPHDEVPKWHNPRPPRTQCHITKRDGSGVARRWCHRGRVTIRRQTSFPETNVEAFRTKCTIYNLQYNNVRLALNRQHDDV